MKMKVWGIFWLVIGLTFFVICLLAFVHGSRKYARGLWVTLAKGTSADGGCYFVRQMGDPFPFCEVGFGYISSSGEQYSYFLDHEGFPWRKVRLLEKSGSIHVLKNGTDVAVFNPSAGYFTNLLEKRTFDEKTGQSGGYGSAFFKFEPVGTPSVIR